jgi:hypothetical protein
MLLCEMFADKDLHRRARENLDQADAPLWAGDLRNDGGSISTTLERVDGNAELVLGDLERAVRQLKREPGKGMTFRGVGSKQ